MNLKVVVGSLKAVDGLLPVGREDIPSIAGETLVYLETTTSC